MDTTIAQKLKNARILLGENQTDAGIKSGIHQKTISLMEAGKRKEINLSYLIYLQNRGIDLNSLFDKNQEIKTIEKQIEKSALEKKIQEQEEMIHLLRDAVELRNRKIQELMSLDAVHQ
ncbi:hypothetical protein ACLOAU_04090 [Niabella sp. CJ426]|uniref:hypothetical protein n=1 Tax=Niabella sp. CJ426 TaxID=3393740 RepID=UPI003CFDD0B6